MNQTISFTLRDVGMIVIWGLLSAVLIYLLLILKRAYQTMKQVNGIIDENEKNINEILDEVPGITKNVNSISNDISKDINAFTPTIKNVAEFTEKTTDTMREYNGVNELLKSLYGNITKLTSVADNIFDKVGPKGKSTKPSSAAKKANESKTKGTSANESKNNIINDLKDDL